MSSAEDRITSALSSRRFLSVLYRAWIALPYWIRKPATALAIVWFLLLKRLAGVERRDGLTPTARLGNLSFSGVPSVSSPSYRLEIAGRVSIW